MSSDRAEQKQRLLEKLLRECGPVICKGLFDLDVSEINLNPDGRLWFDFAGRGMEPVGEMATAHAESMLGTCASLLGTSINRDAPILEGEFPIEGWRLEGVISPVVKQPAFSLRKAAGRVFSLTEYVETGALSAGRAERIGAAVDKRENILVVGGTGSGKTTLSNGILQEVAKRTPRDRVAVIQDTNELQVNVDNHFLLRTTDSIGISRLLRVCMRMQPNRIVVGEVRGGEAQALLKAWNSGHPGGLTTLHADSPKLGLRKLVDYIFEAPGMEGRSDDRVARQVSEVIGLVVFVEKTGGTPARRVTQIASVEGYESGEFILASE